MRIFLGFLVVAVALAGALYLHSGAKFESHRYVSNRTLGGGLYVPTEGSLQPGDSCPSPSGFGLPSWAAACQTVHSRASWQDPLAIFIAIAGVGAGVAIALPAIRGRA